MKVVGITAIIVFYKNNFVFETLIKKITKCKLIEDVCTLYFVVATVFSTESLKLNNSFYVLITNKIQRKMQQ